MAADIKSIDLRNRHLLPLSWLSFLRAEWWDNESRFVLVRYSLKGREQELGLRLDLDKKIFLDHLDNLEFDHLVQAQAKKNLANRCSRAIQILAGAET
jgi:hypothetical protein